MVSVFFVAQMPSAEASTNLFRSKEKQSSSLQSFPKWTGMLSREGRDQRKMDAECGTNVLCSKKRLEKFLASIKKLPPMQQVTRVNQYHNQTRYIQDIVNWGMPDYWETPYEFFGRNGDCEDYAITKYKSLKALGFDTTKMRIVVAQDTNLRIMHSVLAVYMNNTIYILDNQSPVVLEHSRIYHYHPIYSINERGWWRHM